MPVLRKKRPLMPLVPNRGPSERITPETSLDPERLMEAISPAIIAVFLADGVRWALVAPIASYESAHLMAMSIETRYVPGPESLTAVEGNKVIRVAGRCLVSLSRRTAAENVSLGWNYSPNSWGEGLEEQRGYQSMPTIVHFHFWADPPIPEPGKMAVFNDSKDDWVREDELSAEFRRLLIENDHGVPIGSLLAEASREAMGRIDSRGRVASVLRQPGNWSFDARGAVTSIPHPLLEVLATEPELFAGVLQPISCGCAELLCRLTASFTDMDCARLRGILAQIEHGRLPAREVAALRAVPHLRKEDAIRAALERNGLPQDLLRVLLPAIRERCVRAGMSDPLNMWRKGFGYACVLSGPVDGPSCEVRIMPGVYLGAGGVVEAQRVVLSRVPVPAPYNELLRRSRMLFEVGRCAAA
jgi:hypothetical protein